MDFVKMQGIGNDYVYVDCMEKQLEYPEQIAKIVSRPHFGIGADGLILICPSQKADFTMEVYNADGSRAEMCGNGIRCVAKYVYERGFTKKKELEIETLAGIRKVWLSLEDGIVREVTVDMGCPILLAEKIPIISEHSKVIKEKILIRQMEYEITGVSMGNPHAVVYVPKVKGLDLERLGPEFEYHGRFPRRINVEFVQVMDEKTIKLRVWERGAGETLACGTGACAACVASVLNHLTERKVTVKLKGGDLQIYWNEEDGRVYMTGPAVTVYEGYIPLERHHEKGDT